jgi:uncharacterized protein (TIGR02453 family)
MPTSPNLQLTLHFLDDLSRNNNKAWFDAHRPDYEAGRAAFLRLVDEVIDEFRAPDNLKGLSAADCVARIYRDVRFSKDKSPYKTNLSAYIAPGGWKGVRTGSQRQGYYISIAPQGQTIVAGGLHDPSPEQLTRFRDTIERDAAPFKALIGAPAFVEAFGVLDGERLKSAPRGYDPAHPDIDLLRLKEITAVHPFSDAQVLAPDFAAPVIALCRTMRPFLDYLDEIMA